MERTLIEIGYEEVAAGLRSLGIDRSARVIAHASLSAFGRVRGGAEAVVGALLESFAGVMMPAFTYKTMVVPAEGPPNNGLSYGRNSDLNLLAVPSAPDMPADRLMGAVPEALRTHRLAKRSGHPILSFTGVGVADLLDAQQIDDPLGPIRALVDEGGWVLLLGVDQTVNTTLHEAERRAGRKNFIRWALTADGMTACPGFPGCSNGFVELDPILGVHERRVRIGAASVKAYPARPLVESAAAAFLDKPGGFLCKRIDCGRCRAFRS